MSRVGLGGITSARRKKNFWLTTMLLPGAIWLLLLRYLPMLGITIAFKNYRAFKPNTFWNNIINWGISVNNAAVIIVIRFLCFLANY